MLQTFRLHITGVKPRSESSSSRFRSHACCQSPSSSSGRCIIRGGSCGFLLPGSWLRSPAFILLFTASLPFPSAGTPQFSQNLTPSDSGQPQFLQYLIFVSRPDVQIFFSMILTDFPSSVKQYPQNFRIFFDTRRTLRISPGFSGRFPAFLNRQYTNLRPRPAPMHRFPKKSRPA